MRIDLRMDRKLYHAVYSDVFESEGLVFKVFKRTGDPNLDARAATLFEAQCDAYVRAASEPDLKAHIAEFFGPCTISAVHDEDGSNISTRYDLELCYAIEKLHGPEQKVNAPVILSQFPYVFQVRRRFSNNGIDTSDSSVFNYEDADAFKLIDFTSTYF